MIIILETAGPYTAGDTIEYKLVVVNGGPDAATNVLVEDVSTNLTISSVVSASCTAFPCTIPTIGFSDVEDIIVKATINAAGAFDYSASANAVETDPVIANNSDQKGGTAVAAPTPTPGTSKPIPTLSEWALILMSGLLGLAVFVRQRKLL